jgi:regulator of replication initiation timing
MTDEVKVEATEQQETPQLSEVELQAMELGWKPKEQFDEASGKKWRTAEDFLDRKTFFDKIDEQHKRIRTLEKGLQAHAEYNAKIEKAAYERALSDLKKQRRAALEEGDTLLAEDLRDRIDEIKEQVQEVKPAQVAPVELPEPIKQWREKNSWYEKDTVMTNFADGLGNRLVAQGYSPTEVLQQVERAVRENFPAKFRNPNKDNAPQMETGNKKPTAADTFRLSAEEERMMEAMIRAGAPIKREEYIAQIKKSKGA